MSEVRTLESPVTDQDLAAPVRQDSSGRSTLWQTIGINVARICVLAVALGVWEYGSGRWFDPFLVSRPSEIAAAWWDLVTSGDLWFHGLSTFQSFVIGFAIGATVAVALGYLLGGSPVLAAVFEPFVTAVYTIPKLALIPVFVMWFGVGRDLQVLICALVVFFLLFFNTYYGIKDVDGQLIDAVRVMGGSRRHIAAQVRLPSALVWLIAGLKIAVPQGVIAVVVAEILASNQGLGYLVAHNAATFNSDYTFAAIFTLLLIGLAIDRGVGLATRKALAWKR